MKTEFVTKTVHTKNWIWIIWVANLALAYLNYYMIKTASHSHPVWTDFGDSIIYGIGNLVWEVTAIVSFLAIFLLPLIWANCNKQVEVEKTCRNCKYSTSNKMMYDTNKKIYEELECTNFPHTLKNNKPCEEFQLK